MPCSAVSPIFQNLVLQGCVSYVYCLCLGAKPLLPSVQLSVMACFFCCGQVWSLCCYWGTQWLPCTWIESDQAFAIEAIAANCWVLSLCFPLRSFCCCLGPVVRPVGCLKPPTQASFGLVCVVILPSPQDRRPFGMVLVPVRAACTLPDFWHHFGQVPARAQGHVNGVGPQENEGQGMQCQRGFCRSAVRVTRNQDLAGRGHVCRTEGQCPLLASYAGNVNMALAPISVCVWTGGQGRKWHQAAPLLLKKSSISPGPSSTSSEISRQFILPYTPGIFQTAVFMLYL